MEDSSYKKHIVLGVDLTKATLFKVLDMLCNADGLNNNKDVGEKPSGRTKPVDSLDYLKNNFKVKMDNVPVCSIDNGKPSKKTNKRKLMTFKSKRRLSSNQPISFLLPILDTRLNKKKEPEFERFFSEKLLAINFKSPEKITRREMEIEPAVIYTSSSFYRSREAFTFDRNRITFPIYLKEWFTIELGSSHIKTITLYSKHALIKISTKNKIIDELSKHCIKQGVHECDTFKNFPRRAVELRDVMVVLTNKLLTKADYEQLMSIFGLEKVHWNDSEIESKDVLENILCKNPYSSELINSKSCPNWSLIFSPKSPEHHNYKIIQSLVPGHTQNIALQNPPIRMQQHLPQSNLVNVIVNCPTTSTPLKFDSMPNLFHRMRAEPPQMTPANGAYQLPGASPNMSVAALNQFIANGTRPNQPLINVPMLLSVAASVNNIPKPIQTTTLMYIPSRNLDNVFETFHYNPSPDSDVLIHGSDLLCLNFGQYLNDNIINFYLNYIKYEIMTEDQRQRTHLFNVFFNTKLQGPMATFATDSPESRHARVAKWTKKVDIFDKDFIIIPINENQHWFLAIVCFPWMAGMISYDKLLGVNNNQQMSEIPDNKSLFATKYRYQRVQTLRDRYGVEPSPCILLFDSLQYQSRAPNVKLIREYLKSEWDSKRGHTDGPLVFDKNTVRGFNPQVPQQDNNIDCGIFVLHYVEQFFSQPLRLFTKEYFQSSLTTWFPAETVTTKRAAIQQMVLTKADQEQRRRDQCSTAHNTSGSDLSSTTAVQLVTGDGAGGGPDDFGPDIIQIL